MSYNATLDVEKIKHITSAYEIGEIVSSALLSGGYENTNYQVTTDEGDTFVLTISELKSASELKDLAKFLKHLENNNFRTSRVVLSKEKELISVWNGKPVMIKKYIEGRIHEDLSEELLRKVGVELGRLHKVPVPEYISQRISSGVDAFDSVGEYDSGSAFERWLNGIKDYLEPYLEPYLELDLPKACVHTDLASDNIVISPEQNMATMMDFEEVMYHYRVFDLGTTIICSCAQGKTISLEKTRALLAGYQSEIDLEDEEKQALKAFVIYGGASWASWRYRYFNYICPDASMADHYLEFQVLTNYVQAQPDNYFIDGY